MTHSADARAIPLKEVIPGSLVREDDLPLVERARQGDALAFEQLYHRHRDQMYTLCLNLCGDREEARDLLQESFMRAWRGLPAFRGHAALGTWLYRIAVNVCREAARRRRRVNDLPPAAAIADDATISRVRAALKQLRAPHRAVLVLRYSLTLSHREIAGYLNWSIPRVKATLHRARHAFRDAYLRMDEAQP